MTIYSHTLRENTINTGYNKLLGVRGIPRGEAPVGWCAASRPPPARVRCDPRGWVAILKWYASEACGGWGKIERYRQKVGGNQASQPNTTRPRTYHYLEAEVRYRLNRVCACIIWLGCAKIAHVVTWCTLVIPAGQYRYRSSASCVSIPHTWRLLNEISD